MTYRKRLIRSMLRPGHYDFRLYHNSAHFHAGIHQLALEVEARVKVLAEEAVLIEQTQVEEYERLARKSGVGLTFSIIDEIAPSDPIGG